MIPTKSPIVQAVTPERVPPHTPDGRVVNETLPHGTATATGTPSLAQSVRRGLSCKCPRCGEGALLTGFLTLRPACEVCGLDNAFINAGDGPAVFVILIAGGLVVTAALIVEVVYQPPYWLHAALWLPLVAAVTLLPLRAMKSLMIALQYHHKAAEGRLESQRAARVQP